MVSSCAFGRLEVFVAQLVNLAPAVIGAGGVPRGLGLKGFPRGQWLIIIKRAWACLCVLVAVALLHPLHAQNSRLFKMGALITFELAAVTRPFNHGH